MIKVIYKNIQSSGGRLTKIKKAIIDILWQNNCCLSKKQLVEKLKVKKINPHRSTVYRELHFLAKKNIIVRKNIKEAIYFELPKDHHHHLICLNCNSLIKVKMTNHLKKLEKQIAKENNFNIINHSLEFYGYCYKCQPLL